MDLKTFIQFLNKSKCYDEFKSEVEAVQRKTVEEHFNSMTLPQTHLIMSAFVFQKSESGEKFWWNIHNNLLIILENE